MKLMVTIMMDNAAFEDNAAQETARILRALALAYAYYGLKPVDNLYDVNGNLVGTARLKA